jgi:hypothetical protein
MTEGLRHTGIMERPYFFRSFPSSAEADVTAASKQSMVTTMQVQRVVMGGASVLQLELAGPESYWLFFATHHFTASRTVPRGRKGGAPPNLTSIEADVTATSQAANVGEALGLPMTCHPSGSRRVSWTMLQTKPISS